MYDILSKISECIQKGDDELIETLIKKAIENNIKAEEILNKGLLCGMDIISEQFKNHEIFLPDVLLAAKAMYAGMNLLKPMLIKSNITKKGKIVLGTVKGDLHDIGKNLVGIMLQGAGYEVIDLGNDVAPEKFIDTALKEIATIIGMSALLTTTMPVMKNVVELIKENQLSSKIKTIIGGAPVSKEFALQINADAYGYDAANAVEVVNQLLKKNL
jgi:5-methyltetrahydrofolate--homocysteine methyltransferase